MSLIYHSKSMMGSDEVMGLNWMPRGGTGVFLIGFHGGPPGFHPPCAAGA